MDINATAGIKSNKTELTLTRVFDAPRALVWGAWTDPKLVAQWWGPKAFTTSVCEIDLREGGAFRLDLCGPDGVIYPCKGIYHEIVEPERIVYSSDAAEGHPCGAGIPPRSRVTVTFIEHRTKTTLTLHTRFASAARREAAVQARFSISWQESLERLAKYVGTD